MADHDKTDAQPDEMGETIPFTPGGGVIGGGSSWEPERETSFQVLGRKSSENMLKGCIERYPKSHAKPLKHFIPMISNSAMGNCTTETRAHH